MSTTTLWLLTPEIVLIAAAVGVYVGSALVDGRWPWSRIAGGGILAAAVALWVQHGTASAGGPVTIDHLAHYARWLALVLGGLLLMSSSRPPVGAGTPEYVGSLLLTIAGLMLAAGAGDLVLLFVGLELISIPTYVLLYLGRRDAVSQESAAKYFFLSVLASALLLYGFSFLYGATGSTELAAIRAAVAGPGDLAAGFGKLVKVGLVLVFAGLGFKIAAVPFHFYAPDVYQGTTHGNAALLSVIPKAAGLLVLLRIAVVGAPVPASTEAYAWRIAATLAVLTMTFGNVLALWQENLRRLMAYSSIAQAGTMLIGLAVGLATAGAPGQWDGAGAVLFYLGVYAIATIGTFAALTYLGREGQQLDAVDELAGLGRSRPLVAAVIALFLFSLAGIPPLAGFWGKLMIFGSALGVDASAAAGGLTAADGRQAWFVALAIVGVLNAAVAAAYYLRIVGVMYFRTPLATPKAQGGSGAWYVALACAVLVVVVGLYPGPLMHASSDAVVGDGAKNGEARMANDESMTKKLSAISYQLSANHKSEI